MWARKTPNTETFHAVNSLFLQASLYFCLVLLTAVFYWPIKRNHFNEKHKNKTFFFHYSNTFVTEVVLSAWVLVLVNISRTKSHIINTKPQNHMCVTEVLGITYFKFLLL